MEKTNVCDLTYLKTHSPNNPEFLKTMIKMFLEDTPVYVAEMVKCLAAANWIGLQKTAHKIRPSIDLIGMPKDIGIAVKQIEEY